MNSDFEIDSKYFCADLVFADVVQDLTLELGCSQQQVRDAIIESPAFEALYNLETDLWQTGPDYFATRFVKPHLK